MRPKKPLPTSQAKTSSNARSLFNLPANLSRMPRPLTLLPKAVTPIARDLLVEVAVAEAVDEAVVLVVAPDP